MEICKNCKTQLTNIEENCPICNYPTLGSTQDQAKFIAKQVIDKSNVQEAVKRLKNSRIILFIIAAYFIISPFIFLLKNGNSLTSIFVIVFSIILAILFLFFAFLSFKRPKISLLIPLIAISIYYVALLFIDPFNLFWKGVLWKTFIILGLSYGYFSVRKSDKILKENKYLASLFGFNKIK